MQGKTYFMKTFKSVFLSTIFFSFALLIAKSSLAQASSSVIRQEFVDIPIVGAGLFGRPLQMKAELFKPSDTGSFPVMMYLHGRSGTQAERSALAEVVPREYLNYWLDKGFAVIGPMRPGYGKTGGPDKESPLGGWQPNGVCVKPNFNNTINNARQAADATLEWVRSQPWAKPNAIVVSGNSVGGITTVSVASSQPLGVVGYINFAGGIGGNPSLSPSKSCDPEQIRDLFDSFGSKTKLPGLWLYAANDLFWGADAPRDWHMAFSKGNRNSQFVATPPLENKDGHQLIFSGKSLWKESVDTYLKSLGF